MRILLIEDDRKMREFLEISLQAACFSVDIAEDGERGSYIARTNDYDLIMCEYFLPEKSSISVCKEIRNAQKKTPIIILSESRDIDDKIACFNAGADDYVLKPCAFEELHARMRVMLRRPRNTVDHVLEIRNLRLESGRQRVLYKQKELYLTRKEFALLEYLMRNAGCVLSRGMILEHVWNMDINPFSNTIETHIMNLRKKVCDLHKEFIVCVPGRGYKMNM